MALKDVEAVWVWDYNVSAQKATYGRFTDDPSDRSFTKDYLQASGSNGTLLATTFASASGSSRSDITYKWPGGLASGFVIFSVDRQHLSWATGAGGPAPWRFTAAPTVAGPETFPGSPGATTQAAASAAVNAYARRGLNGVLVAVKLAGETDILHLRAYIDSPPPLLAFASTDLLPNRVRRLTVGFNRRRACQSDSFAPGDVYFDPAQNHDAWSDGARSPVVAVTSATSTGTNGTPLPVPPALVLPPGASSNPLNDDAGAEVAPFDQAEADDIAKKVAAGDFTVPNAFATVATRGSAQRVFANAVKSNYGYRCAITGISTRAFLVASHIVPWAEDETIRTDPSNGICLSTLVDRAFDAGYLSIGMDLVVTIHSGKLTGDHSLQAELGPYNGVKLQLPKVAPPNLKYIRRRLESPPS